MTERAEPGLPQEPADSGQVSARQTAEIRSNPEISEPMLDVHAPHETVHSWKDFFIHIATITTGLLIAIALEQTVEYLHHRHQAKEMADNLRAESLANRRVVEFNIANCDRAIGAIEKDMRTLENMKVFGEHAASVLIPIPTTITYYPSNSAWLTIKDSALLPIVDKMLVRNYWGVDAVQQSIVFTSQESWNSRVQLDALLNMRTTQQVASAQERDALLLALSNFREQQMRLRGQMAAFKTFNNLALAGKIVETDPGSIEQPSRTH
jgi:cold shock CspA family protein